MTPRFRSVTNLRWVASEYRLSRTIEVLPVILTLRTSPAGGSFVDSGVAGLPTWELEQEEQGGLHARVRAAERRIVQLTRQLVQSQSRRLQTSGLDADSTSNPSTSNLPADESAIQSLTESLERERQQWALEREQLQAEIAQRADWASQDVHVPTVDSKGPEVSVTAGPIVTSSISDASQEAIVASTVGFDPDNWFGCQS